MEKGKFALYDEAFYLNPKFDIEKCKLEAKKGDPEAQVSLAECYLGEFFNQEKNYEEAYVLAKKASEEGIGEAFFLLGYLYNYGVHVEKNIDIDIPLGKIVTFTGVSGSGKSTLMQDLIPATLRYLKREIVQSLTVALL